MCAALLLAGCAEFPKMLKDDPAEKIDPAQQVQLAQQRGDAAYLKGDAKGALFHYVSGLKFEPDNIDLMYRVGMVHLENDQLNSADRAFSRILELEPDHAGALEGHGLALLQQRKFDVAKYHLIKAVHIDDKRWRAQNGLGVISDIEKDHALAITYYQLALEQRPDSAMVLNNLGYSRYLAGEWDSAENAFNRAVSIDPQHRKAWSNLGMLYVRKEKYEDALQAFSRLMPKHEAYNSMGYVCMLEGNYTRAEAFFTDAIRFSPKYYKEAQDNLARARERRGVKTDKKAEALKRLDVKKSK